MTPQDHGHDAFIALLMVSLEADALLGCVARKEEERPSFLQKRSKKLLSGCRGSVLEGAVS